MSRPTYQSVALSGSTNYLPLNITGVATGSANVIHTAHATNTDELWLDLYNYTNTDTFVTLMLGGSASHQLLVVPVPSQRGMIPLLKGQRFDGGVVISAFASAANRVAIVGQVNRIVYI